MKPKYHFTVIFLLSFVLANSQKREHTQEYPWRMTAVDENVFVFNELHPYSQSAIFYDSDSSAIMPVWFSKEKDGGAITKISRSGLVMWQIPTEGSFAALTAKGKNLLVFTKIYNKSTYNALK